MEGVFNLDSDSPVPLFILGFSLLGFLLISSIWGAFGLAGKYAGPPWNEDQAPTRATQRLISRYERTSLLISTLRIVFLLSASISLASWLIPQEWARWVHVVGVAIGMAVLLGVTAGIAVSLGYRYSRSVLVTTATGLVWMGQLLGPILWTAERLGIAALRLNAQDNDGTNGHKLLTETEEDQLPVEEVREANPEERRMIRGILELEDVAAREVMVPRVDIVSVSIDSSLSEVALRMGEDGHSRLPVYRDGIDNIIGVVHARDVLSSITSDTDSPLGLENIIRPALFIPDSKPIDQLLKDLRIQRVSIAIVVDEYGGVEGVLTIEDILEEIVGEIEDEFQKEAPAILRLSDTEVLVDGRVNLEDINDLFRLSLQGEGFDTIGGLLSASLGKIPSVGDVVVLGNLSFQVVSIHGRRVRQVRIVQNTEATT